MRRLVLVLACACGTTGQVPSGASDAASFDDVSDVGVTPVPSATQTSPRCVLGSERIEVNDGKSVRVLERACPYWSGEAGAPTASGWTESEDGPIVAGINGCDDAGAFFSAAMEVGGDMIPPTGVARPTNVVFGTFSSQGVMIFDSWPDAGSVVSGTYSASDFQSSTTLTGRFCALRISPP